MTLPPATYLTCVSLLLTLRSAACLPDSPEHNELGPPNTVHDSSPDFKASIQNVTVAVGREAILSCSVTDLGNFKVGWLKAEDQTILTLHTKVVTHNSRVGVSHDGQNTWFLHIRQVKESDRGCYMCQINTSQMRKQLGCIDVYVPPDIIDTETSSDVTVKEEQNATLVCRAKGHPTPRILWRREDGELLEIRTSPRDIQRVESYAGELLSLTRVMRGHMGAYLCIASNDVPPAVSKRVILNVNFAPSVKIPNQLLGAPIRTDVLLECHIEAFPNTINYWVKNRDEMLLHGPKHIIEEERSLYKVHLKLTVTKFSAEDVGTYKCVSSNSLGKADGTIRLYELYVPTKQPTTTTTTTELTTTTTRAVGTTTTLKSFEFKRVFSPFPTTLAPLESLHEQSPIGHSANLGKDPDDLSSIFSSSSTAPQLLTVSQLTFLCLVLCACKPVYS